MNDNWNWSDIGVVMVLKTLTFGLFITPYFMSDNIYYVK